MHSSEIIQYWESKYASDKIEKLNFDLEPLLHGFLSAFSPGKSFYYIANFKNIKLQFVSEGIYEFSGLEPDAITFEKILSLADPGQINEIKLKEQVAYDFYFNFLPSDEVKAYKLVYLYKMRDAKGQARVMMHQALVLNLDAQGNLEHALSIHTDISYLGIQPDNSISFFSLRGGTSYINLNTERGMFDPETQGGSKLAELLTPREREIISFLAKGLSSKEISSILNLSVHTIQKHRKNILQKTGFSNTSELVSNCIMEGLFN